MKKINILKGTLGVMFCIAISANAQQQDINRLKIAGSSATVMDPNAQLDLQSTMQGLLNARVTLTSTTDATTVGALTAGMSVYNTATAGTVPNNVTPGYYVSDGAKWVRMADEALIDMRLLGSNNHITKDAGFGGNGTSVGTGTDNIGIGFQTLRSNDTGAKNVAVGSGAIRNNTTGGSNTALGSGALNRNLDGSFNTAIGNSALTLNTTGSSNVVIGDVALSALTAGEYNVAIGRRVANTQTSGSRNIIIGGDIDLPNVTGSNQLNIGNLIYGTGIDGTNSTLSTGNIGIGVTMPSTKLHILSNASPLRIQESSMSTSVFNGLEFATGANTVFGGLLGNQASGEIRLDARPTYFPTFYSSGAEVMRIATNGRVGIGVTDLTVQQGKLQIAATQDPLRLVGVLMNSAPLATDEVLLLNNVGVVKKTLVSSLASAAEPWFKQVTGVGATLNTDDVYTMGKVGIGATTTGMGDQLTITGGDISLTTVGAAFNTTVGTYADYVFEDYVDGFSNLNKNYTFKTLEEVDKFVTVNKHLPGVTSINDLVKTAEGNYVVNISALSGQLLEKVEELFLHTIQQEKTINALEVENDALKSRLAKIEAALGIKN